MVLSGRLGAHSAGRLSTLEDLPGEVRDSHESYPPDVAKDDDTQEPEN